MPMLEGDDASGQILDRGDRQAGAAVENDLERPTEERLGHGLAFRAVDLGLTDQLLDDRRGGILAEPHERARHEV
jgi:hypothetical protein